jgi:diguanylate cyclase (GGDEF)-like protein
VTQQPDATQHRRADPPDRTIRRAWALLSGTFALLAVVVLVKLVIGGAQPLDWAMLLLLGLVGLGAIRHRQAALALESGRRSEAESFARILSGLSRSVSPDAIVRAIVEELGSATGADHVVVVRRRPDAMVLEATLTSTRPGVPDSSTILPIGDLMDRLDTEEVAVHEIEPVAIPVLATSAATADVRQLELVGAGVAAGGSPGGDDPVRRATLRSRGSTAWAGFTARVGAGGLGPDDADPGAESREPTQEQAIAERIAGRVRRTYGLTHTLAAPLTSEHGVIGAIVISRRVGDAWPAATRRILGGAALEASTALARVYSHRAAEARASTDALTGLPNRRYFDEFCGLLARRRRAEDAVGVLMVDIDHFKRLNDSHGHDTGDVVLRAVGGAIMSAVREDDVPARYGGEEFVVLLRNPSRDIAIEVGERVRTAVRDLDLRDLGVSRATVSVGVAVAQLPDEPIADIIKAADRALYRAKRGGRDKVVAA